MTDLISRKKVIELIDKVISDYWESRVLKEKIHLL